MVIIRIYKNNVLYRFAGNKSTVRDVSQRFDMTESSFHRVMDRMINFFMDLGPVMIRMPKTIDEKANFQKEFKKVSLVTAIQLSISTILFKLNVNV